MRGEAYERARDEEPSLAVCQALADVWHEATAEPEEPSEVANAPLPVPLPEPEALSTGMLPAPEAEALEGFTSQEDGEKSFQAVPPSEGEISRNLDEAEGSEPGVSVSRPLHRGGFPPEHRTFFWEAAHLLTQVIPMAAVALWMEEPRERRPVLTYSPRPLSQDLKQQVLAHITYHVPGVAEQDLHILTRVEDGAGEPLTGAFQTHLPVLLVGEGSHRDLLMLFRLENHPFGAQEQLYIEKVGRMLGLHLQEVRLHERYHRAFLSVSLNLLSSSEGGAPNLKDHSLATARLCRSFGRHLDLPTPELEALSLAALLHDVGTFLMDPLLLNKPNLSAEEIARLRAHPVLATTFLKDLRFPYDVLKIIRHHHERWDGQGYPEGLKGTAIPLASRVIHLVEAFEVMSHGNAFQPPKPLRAILEELQRGAGSQFDPTLVSEFIHYLQMRRGERGTDA